MPQKKSGGFSKARLRGMRDVMAGYVARAELPGLVTLISRRGETHVNAYGTMAVGGSAPMKRDTIFRIASMTKPITAVAAMILVEECKLRLFDPVDKFLPEIANLKVLKRIDGPLDDVVPAKRPINLRDLLTFRAGFGLVMSPNTSIYKAFMESGLSPGPNAPKLNADEFMKRLGALPMLHQPGEQWLYHTGSDVLGVLIARVSGQSFEDFLAERIFTPLGMKDTGFFVPPKKLNRLPPAYMVNPTGPGLAVFDGGPESHWGRPPSFTSGGGGLVSTVDDYLAFSQMMLNGGKLGRTRILARPTIELMTMDHLTPEQRHGGRFVLGAQRGWGFGMGVYTQRDFISATPGRFGWDGGIGTSGYADPAEQMIGILMTQKLMQSPAPPEVFVDFWTSAYQAIDD